MSKLANPFLLLAVFGCGIAVGHIFDSRALAQAQSDKRVFELRTYTSPDGKLSDLQARFRNHTTALFQIRHHQCRLLGPPGCAALTEHARLHDCVSQPRRSEEALGRVPSRCRLAEGVDGVSSERPSPEQGRINLPGSARFFADEVGGAGAGFPGRRVRLVEARREPGAGRAMGVVRSSPGESLIERYKLGRASCRSSRDQEKCSATRRDA